MGCSRCEVNGYLLNWYAIVRRVEDVDEMCGTLRLLLHPSEDTFDVEIVRENIQTLGYTSHIQPHNPSKNVQLNTDIPEYIFEKNKRLLLAMKRRFETITSNQTFVEYLRSFDNAFKTLEMV
jgi:hypothetical protein